MKKQPEPHEPLKLHELSELRHKAKNEQERWQIDERIDRRIKQMGEGDDLR